MNTTSAHSPAQDLTLSVTDWRRICRDIAWSEIAAMPGSRTRLGSRITAPHAQSRASEAESAGLLSWGSDTLALDSLARLQLATAAATWCNAYDWGLEDRFLAKRSVTDWAAVMQRCRAAGARHFTFSTSGSTGVRKHIRHREDVLTNEARVWAKVLGQPKAVYGAGNQSTSGLEVSDNPASIPVKRVVLLCPTHHIYGFIWGVLLPQVLGVPVVDAELDCMPPSESGDLVVGVPDQWAWLAGSTRQWPEGVQGVSSTAPLPDTVHRAMRTPSMSSVLSSAKDMQSDASLARPPLVRLFQIYGSTETAGMAYRTAPGAAYTLAPGRSRNTVDGIALTLPDGSMAHLNVQDELQWTSEAGADNSFDKTALLARAAQSSFHILRRIDHSVQVGGHNVSLGWVEDQLRLHAAVKHASVRLSTGGKVPRLKAFIVLNSTDSASQRQALEQWAIDTLPWYANFSAITYGKALPVNIIGKPCDWPESS